MTEKQRRFVEEYVRDGNATQAAKRAGFSAKSARRIGTRLSTDVHIRAAIEKARGPALDAAQVTLEGHLRELADIRDAALAAKQFAPAATCEVSRGKVSGFYVDRQELTGAGGGALAVTVTRRIVRGDGHGH